jgi:hypothetical protein
MRRESLPRMMTRRLGRILLQASLIALPASGCCMFGDDSGTEHRFASRAVYGAEIDECVADATKCYSMCAELLADETGEKDIDRCEVSELRLDGVMLEIHWTELCVAGRRPRGFAGPPPPRGSTGAGAWLARAATLEAASVTAVARRIGAPRARIASARRAIADEIVHARVVARLARARGATVEPPAIAVVHEPTLAELAHDNAVEGQVGETFGALVATCQARAATDPEIRAAYTRIARDETRHAALAHALAPWLERRLRPAERAAIRDARGRAVAALTTECAMSAHDRALLGLPASAPLHRAATATFAALARAA